MSFAINPANCRQILGHYPTGVCVVTAISTNGQPIGMTVGSFTSVSLDPPLVGFFPDRRSTTWAKIEAAGKFCVNILAEHQEPLCRVFARSDQYKFSGLDYGFSQAGLPVLGGIVAWIECDLYAVHEAGDHFIVIGQVLSFEIENTHGPLVFLKGGYGQFLPRDS